MMGGWKLVCKWQFPTKGVFEVRAGSVRGLCWGKMRDYGWNGCSER